MKLLSYLPELAKRTQKRFFASFQSLAIASDSITVHDVLYIVHYIKNDAAEWQACKTVTTVISLCKEYGKDCQVLQLNSEGSVVEL